MLRLIRRLSAWPRLCARRQAAVDRRFVTLTASDLDLDEDRLVRIWRALPNERRDRLAAMLTWIDMKGRDRT